MDAFDIQLTEILIHRIHEGIFFAKLICQSAGESIEIDSRTSDALALAVRFECPIYTYENILQQAGLHLDESTLRQPGTEEKLQKVPVPKNDLVSMSMTELQTLLQEVLDKEDYIRAAQIRDEINSRK